MFRQLLVASIALLVMSTRVEIIESAAGNAPVTKLHHYGVWCVSKAMEDQLDLHVDGAE